MADDSDENETGEGENENKNGPDAGVGRISIKMSDVVDSILTKEKPPSNPLANNPLDKAPTHSGIRELENIGGHLGGQGGSKELGENALTPHGKWFAGFTVSAGLMGGFGRTLGATYGGSVNVNSDLSANAGRGMFVPEVGLGIYFSAPGPGIAVGYSWPSSSNPTDCVTQVSINIPILTFTVAGNLAQREVSQVSFSASESIGFGVFGGTFCGQSTETRSVTDVLTEWAVKEFGGDPFIGLINSLYQGF